MRGGLWRLLGQCYLVGERLSVEVLVVVEEAGWLIFPHEDTLVFHRNTIVDVAHFIAHSRLVCRKAPLVVHNKFVLIGARQQVEAHHTVIAAAAQRDALAPRVERSGDVHRVSALRPLQHRRHDCHLSRRLLSWLPAASRPRGPVEGSIPCAGQRVWRRVRGGTVPCAVARHEYDIKWCYVSLRGLRALRAGLWASCVTVAAASRRSSHSHRA
mmetsp:Transcript_26707/g.74669  ORF Transcript_26707/g.74669 Transcript_26707/m.74669 type:complete len:213 (+) Transcript_26707:1526-2164(+)|eukprot:scaffold317715_cov38-Tisochrysis_lutea.AAC.1